MLELEIRKREADIVKLVTTDSKYFQNGKAYSMAYIEATYKVTGFDNELIPLKTRLGELQALIEKLRASLDIYKSMLEVWRTLSANERSAGNV